MTPFLSMPLLSWLCRRLEPQSVAEVLPWPGNPRTVADDLKESLANEAELSRRLVTSQLEAAKADGRSAAAVLRADEAEAKYERLAEHCVVAFGYTDADFEEITGRAAEKASQA